MRIRFEKSEGRAQQAGVLAVVGLSLLWGVLAAAAPSGRTAGGVVGEEQQIDLNALQQRELAQPAERRARMRQRIRGEQTAAPSEGLAIGGRRFEPRNALRAAPAD